MNSSESKTAVCRICQPKTNDLNFNPNFTSCTRKLSDYNFIKKIRIIWLVLLPKLSEKKLTKIIVTFKLTILSNINCVLIATWVVVDVRPTELVA